MTNYPAGFRSSLTTHGRISELSPGSWRLEILPGEKSGYCLAQLDDYHDRSRRDFCWQPGTRLVLQARASAAELPGTWGFGLWNDPFSMSILGGSGKLRLPTLPNTAWYFFASAPNYLSLRDDLPAQGSMASTFRSRRLPSLLLALGALGLPLLFFPPVVRLMRRLGRRIVQQDGVALDLDPSQWHSYELAWGHDVVEFKVDAKCILRTDVVPHGPLGFVLWVDNQYAALPPNGRIGYGHLPVSISSWIEIRDLCLTS